jgi:hypothetical protein
MYTSTKEYYAFLEEQRIQRETQLALTKHNVIEEMTGYMERKGWIRMPKRSKVLYAKEFNNRVITIEFRCSFSESYKDGGYPEFVHDRSIPSSVEVLRMGTFHWNDQDTSGWSLNTVMERIETFYEKYTV